MASDERERVCSLGEATVISMLKMWESHTSEQVLEFLIWQMAAHHPMGASEEAEGN